MNEDIGDKIFIDSRRKRVGDIEEPCPRGTLLLTGEDGKVDLSSAITPMD